MNFTIEQDNFDVWVGKKQKDFLKEGYSEISSEDIWEYCTEFKWKRGMPQRYHQKVSDILSLTVNDYFNYASLKAQVYDVASLDDMEIDDLLG